LCQQEPEEDTSYKLFEKIGILKQNFIYILKNKNNYVLFLDTATNNIPSILMKEEAGGPKY